MGGAEGGGAGQRAGMRACACVVLRRGCSVDACRRVGCTHCAAQVLPPPPRPCPACPTHPHATRAPPALPAPHPCHTSAPCLTALLSSLDCCFAPCPLPLPLSPSPLLLPGPSLAPPWLLVPACWLQVLQHRRRRLQGAGQGQGGKGSQGGPQGPAGRHVQVRGRGRGRSSRGLVGARVCGGGGGEGRGGDRRGPRCTAHTHCVARWRAGKLGGTGHVTPAAAARTHAKPRLGLTLSSRLPSP